MTHVAASALGRGAPAAAAAPVPLLGMVTDEAGAVGVSPAAAHLWHFRQQQ